MSSATAPHGAPAESDGRALTIHNAQVFQPSGAFATTGLSIRDGFFLDTVPSDTDAATAAATATTIDGAGLWIIPGVYDVHTHISWGDFHREAREGRSVAERAQQTRDALLATLRAGVTGARDGGGAPATLRDDLASGQIPGPRLQVAVDMIGPADAGSVDSVRRAVGGAVEKGASWIKLVATAGVATPGDEVLRSNFSREQFHAAAHEAARGGARLMVHSWGGDSVDWAIEVGAASIEHGIYLTDDQASRATDAGTVFVPTLTIYRHVRDMVRSGQIGGVPLARIDGVVAVHEDAVKRARDAGLPIALGSDFSTPTQHGTNLIEIASLIRAGLPTADALLAATAHGARLLADGGTGIISPNSRADAVILGSDPLDPVTFENRSSVVAVIQDGRIVHSTDPRFLAPDC